MSRIPVSVVVITKNEEHNIEDCLKSVHGWADEIVLVDDHSQDRTVEIAEKYTDKIFQRKMDIEGRHRNWAYGQARNTWVLSLDADERLTEELKQEIDQVLPEATAQAYTIPRRNFIGQFWLQHGGAVPVRAAAPVCEGQVPLRRSGSPSARFSRRGDAALDQRHAALQLPRFWPFFDQAERPNDLGSPEMDSVQARDVFWQGLLADPGPFPARVPAQEGLQRWVLWFYVRLFWLIISDYQLCQVLGDETERLRVKVVFLDRDGVINEFPGNGNYVTKVKDFHFIPGSLESIRRLTEEGFVIFVVSNQAGVGKGVYTKQKLEHINRNMLRAVQKHGGKIKRVFYCTHRSDAGCDCRKPAIGNIRKAFELVDKPLSLARKTYFVGDTEGDIETGVNAGCKTIFVLSGREDRRHLRGWAVKPDYVVRDLSEAVKIIINNHIK